MFPPWQAFLRRAHAAPCAAGVFTDDGEPPPVWPDAAGAVRGLGVVPLYCGAPKAARKDGRLYELLAVADLLRGGRARERAWAEKRIERMLKATATLYLKRIKCTSRCTSTA